MKRDATEAETLPWGTIRKSWPVDKAEHRLKMGKGSRLDRMGILSQLYTIRIVKVVNSEAKQAYCKKTNASGKYLPAFASCV